jgi:dipeptidase
VIPDYSLGQLSSNTVIINQCRDWLPDPIGGVMWVGMSGGDINCYVPFYAGVTRLPKTYTTGVRTKFDWNSAFWLFYFVGKWARLDYKNMIKEIQQAQYEVESGELARQEGIDEEAYTLYLKSPDSAREFLTRYCIDNAEKVIERWRELASHLIVKYGPVTAFVPPEDIDDPWRK